MTTGAMITDPEDYFSKGCGRCRHFDTPACKALNWGPGLAALRAICLDLGLSETAKWGHPCYMHAGRNVAIIGAFAADFRLTFFYPALLRDPDGILQKQGPNSQTAGTIRFAAPELVSPLAATIRAYLQEAMGYAEQGLLPPKTEHDIDAPESLLAAFETDPDLSEAFFALTPGRQRSWALHLNSTRNPQTQVRRIARMRDRVLAGKGWNER